MHSKTTIRIIACIPLLAALWVWFSPLAFVPVPWPDDSAFYFVGKEFFRWPPRWVMLPQAPFEPTYRIFNFNTMPLYPMIVGFGRLIGIDGSFAIKFWPLLAWAISGSLLATSLLRAKLPLILALIFTLGFSLDPIHRWASVLVRPESLIGLCGLAIVLGTTLGFPRRLRPHGLWDPIAALLATAAYCHFNAVHLLFPVIATFLGRPRQLIAIGLKTTLYLVPWLITIAIHPKLFIHQMSVQWTRLTVPNDTFTSFEKSLESFFQSMGSPEPWPPIVHPVSIVIWLLIFVALICYLVFPALHWVYMKTRKPAGVDGIQNYTSLNLVPSAAWVIGSLWLWYTKPETWFTYYLHAAIWTFVALAALKYWRNLRHEAPESKKTIFFFKTTITLNALLSLFMVVIYGYIDVSQAIRLGKSQSWRWETYYDLVQCIDQQLIQLEKRLNHPQPFRIWAPTFPDVTIELSMRHPQWELTRTNDFWELQDRAIQHGREVEAVVVPETINYEERNLSGPLSEFPEVQSAWMTWDGYFLRRLWDEPGWKPDRYLCQRGRWQAFIFMNRPQQN